MAILESKISFGIVLYNEKLNDSITFLTLVKSIKTYNCKSNEKIVVYVFDNTPSNSDQRFTNVYYYGEHIEVNYYTEGKNKGLPYAYNFFAEKASKNSVEWLTLLDQDTNLPIDFFEKYIHADIDINVHCPLVYSNGNLMSPSYYRNFRSSRMEVPTGNFIPLKDISCINSGLLINVNFYMEMGGYNTSLFLDFCDHDFMDRVKKKGEEKLGIISVTLIQQFSAQTHTKKQALVRYELFVTDLKQYYKDKNILKLLFLVDLPRILRLILKYKTIEPLRIRNKK